MRGLLFLLLLREVLQASPSGDWVLMAQQLPQQLPSPGYPEPYVKGQTTTTVIQAPEGFAVRLLFLDFDLEASPDCAKDWVMVSTDGNGTDPARLCGPRGSALGFGPGPRPFVSSGRTLLLRFHSQPGSIHSTRHPHKGFLALYQAVPSRDPDTINVPGATVSQGHHGCPGPYYQTVTEAGPTQDSWTDRQNGGSRVLCVPVCGRPVTPIPTVPPTLGSWEAELGSFPWQAFTSIHGRGGGALLGDRWVLTAAHTLHPKHSVAGDTGRRVDVYLGHTDVDVMLASGSLAVRQVHVHPDYQQDAPHSFQGDLALLELQHPISVGPHLRPVCLPSREALYLQGTRGYVSGFGAHRGWLVTKLKYSGVTVAPRERCEAWLRERGRKEVFSPQMFCAGDESQDSGVCQGDSGSVLVVWDGLAQHWVATGIVSWGIGCGKGYGFYTNILSYMDWIQRVVDGKD